ncbi:MAG: hypothetical protein P1V36_18155 [Planctomycetota bacterium]|nr:hypothetical protein [Planctomycetota bacterium]
MRTRRLTSGLGAALSAGALVFGLFAGSAAADVGTNPPVVRAPSQKGAQDERLATRAMWSLAWHESWKAAMLLNRIESRKPMPIFHLRILGDLGAKT